MQRSHAHPSCVSRSARWASSSQSFSPTSNEYTLAHSVAGALHCHGGRCRDGPTDSLLPGVRCQTRQLGAQGFWFLFFSFLLPSRRAHAACKRRRTPRVCCGDRAHVHAHDEQRPQPRSPTLPPMVRWLGEKASPVGKHRLTGFLNSIALHSKRAPSRPEPAVRPAVVLLLVDHDVLLPGRQAVWLQPRNSKSR